jgi:hypothetical protein
MKDRTEGRTVTTDRPRLSLASATADVPLPARTPAGPQRPESVAWEALQAALAGTPGEQLADALSEYGRVSAYTAGPDATPVTVTVAGRTIRLDLTPAAVLTLTEAAYDMAEDMIRGSALDAPVVPTPAAPVAPIVRRPALSVLPGGAA